MFPKSLTGGGQDQAMARPDGTIIFIRQALAGAVLLAVLLVLAVRPARAESQPALPRNVIIFIGDGMGINHLNAAKIAKGTLNLEQFTITGLLTNFSIDELISSSAASTTAMVSGVNTLNGVIGLDRTGMLLENAMEYARENGKGTGLVVTSTVTDATPACFVAHVSSRTQQDAIAEALVDSGVDVVMGGGRNYFIPKSVIGSARKDEKDLLVELAKTHTMVSTTHEFQVVGTPRRLVALLADDNLPGAALRPISLTQMTEKAIAILSQYENGFFLMVEGSQIDWAGHRGYGEQIIQETVDMDDALTPVLDFARKDGHTLVVVTSDHETGGFTVLDGSVKEKKVSKAVFLTGNHTSAMVPLFAYGPGSEVLSGMHPNTFLGKVLVDYMKRSLPVSSAQK
ncbi:MAG: alkaline phosphatase [Candidatus Omnitrophica bacterium]|nr:alkaline phosphatase [Candidatus Omnitrophota bacterium]